MILVAVLLDRLLGEPRRFHPLVGFGNLARRVEKLFYGAADAAPAVRYMRGIVSVCVLLVPLVALAAMLQQSAIFDKCNSG